MQGWKLQERKDDKQASAKQSVTLRDLRDNHTRTTERAEVAYPRRNSVGILLRQVHKADCRGRVEAVAVLRFGVLDRGFKASG